MKMHPKPFKRNANYAVPVETQLIYDHAQMIISVRFVMDHGTQRLFLTKDEAKALAASLLRMAANEE